MVAHQISQKATVLVHNGSMTLTRTIFPRVALQPEMLKHVMLKHVML